MKQLPFLGSLGVAGAVTVLAAQPVWAEVAQVTGVRLNPTPSGLEVILETPGGQPLQAFSASYGRTFITDIITTRLRLPDGNAFRANNPAPGINSVEVIPLDSNSVRVKVVSEAGTPTAQVVTRGAGLVVSLTTAPGTTAVRPTPTAPGIEPGTPLPSIDSTAPGVEPDAQIPPVSPTAPGIEPGTVTSPGVEPGTGTPPITPTTPSAEPGTGTPLVTPTEPGVEPGTGTPSTAETPREESIELTVTAQRETRYSVPNASTATRTETPIRDIPQSIQAVPQEVIEDQQAVRLDEAVRNVSGVYQEGGFGNTINQFNIRGFSVNNIFRDSFRDNQAGFPETANVERVEVLKGPASVLFGNVEPGGIINLIPKRPLADPFYEIELTVGNYSTYRPRIDLSGPLTPNRSLLYRLNAVYETAESFRDFDQGIERYFAAPTLNWRIGENTDLLVEFEYLNDERPFDRGLVASGTGVLGIPRDRILGEPDDVRRVEEYAFGYRLEHKFNDNWTVRNAFRLILSDTFDFRAEPLVFNEETGILTRNFRSNDDIDRNYALQTNVIGKVATGPVRHTLLFGVDLARRESEGTQRRLPNGLTPDLNVFDPVYNAIPRPSVSDLTNLVRDSRNRSNTLGVYVQDQIDLLDNLKLLVGGRFDIVDQRNDDLLSDSTTDQYDDAFTPRAGIVYQPIEPVSLYFSYSQSFQPNFATNAQGEFLEPERGTQYEVGIKTDFLDGRLSSTLAFYQITKDNVATIDPDNSDFSVPAGKIRSRGIELDVSGQILPGWNIIASYAYNDSRVIESNDLPIGLRTANVPEHSASLWTSYEIQRGTFRGLGFGLGLFFVGEREGDFDNTYQLPDYMRTDAAIFYQRNNLRAAINIKNLFNVRYYESVNFGRTTIEPGAPLAILGSLTVEF